MKIRTKKNLFAGALALGTIWNDLCLLRILPFRHWPVSFAIVGGGSLLALLPLVFPGMFPEGEVPAHMADPKKKGWVLSGASVCLGFSWAVTIAACVVYTL